MSNNGKMLTKTGITRAKNHPKKTDWHTFFQRFFRADELDIDLLREVLPLAEKLYIGDGVACTLRKPTIVRRELLEVLITAEGEMSRHNANVILISIFRNPLVEIDGVLFSIEFAERIVNAAANRRASVNIPVKFFIENTLFPTERDLDFIKHILNSDNTNIRAMEERVMVCVTLPGSFLQEYGSKIAAWGAVSRWQKHLDADLVHEFSDLICWNSLNCRPERIFLSDEAITELTLRGVLSSVERDIKYYK